MTRKDFRLIADALRRTRPIGFDSAFTQWRYDVIKIADDLQKANVRFDRTKFLEACGYWENWAV